MTGAEQPEGCGGGRWALLLPQAATWPYPGLQVSARPSVGERKGAEGEVWAGGTRGWVLVNALRKSYRVLRCGENPALALSV